MAATICPYCGFDMTPSNADPNVFVCTNKTDPVGTQGLTKEHVALLTLEPTQLPVRKLPSSTLIKGVPSTVAKRSH